LQVFANALAGLQQAQRFGADGARVDLHDFTEQRILVAEGRVETGGLHAYGLAQIGHGGAFVALAPEHLHGLLQRLVAVEAARAATGFYHRFPLRGITPDGNGVAEKCSLI